MSDASLIDGVGFGAAGLVLATFCMRSMTMLRWVAIASNLAFIAYGYLDGLPPVLLLHILLLPVNVYRLTQLRGAHVRRDSSTAGGRRARDAERPLVFDALQAEVLKHRGGGAWQTGRSSCNGPGLLRPASASPRGPRNDGESTQSHRNAIGHSVFR